MHIKKHFAAALVLVALAMPALAAAAGPGDAGQGGQHGDHGSQSQDYRDHRGGQEWSHGYGHDRFNFGPGPVLINPGYSSPWMGLPQYNLENYGSSMFNSPELISSGLFQPTVYAQPVELEMNRSHSWR